MAFHRPRRVELLFRQEVGALLDRFFRIPAGLDLGEITARLADLVHVPEVVETMSGRIAERMITGLAVQNARNWREAATRSTRGRDIYQALRTEDRGTVGDVKRRLVAEHALLIRSLPAEVAIQASTFIAAQQMAGVRAATIAKDLRERLPGTKTFRINMLARTGVMSSATSLTRARSEYLGLPCYAWDTSEDARVRRSHAKMDKVIVFWSEPPAPEALVGEKSTLGHYHAGQCPNCRCDPNPITTLSEVKWPARVYHGGQIQRMGRGAFAALSGMSN